MPRITGVIAIVSGALLMPFSARAGSQIITFDAIPGQILGIAPFQIFAESNLWLPVTFNSNEPAVCTVLSGLVTLLSVGTCSITATQAGTTNVSAASATRTFI